MSETFDCPNCGAEIEASRSKCPECQTFRPYEEEGNLKGNIPILQVSLGCRNCPHEWDRRFKKKDEVIDKAVIGQGRGVDFIIDQSEAYRSGKAPSLKRTRHEVCPWCGLDHTVFVKEREKIFVGESP